MPFFIVVRLSFGKPDHTGKSREELAPQLKWAVGAHGGEAGHEVILRCLDGRLGGIDSVVVRLDQLDPHLFFSNLVLDGLGALVVQDMELWFASSCR